MPTNNLKEFYDQQPPLTQSIGEGLGKAARAVVDTGKAAAQAIYETPIPTLNPAVANATSRVVSGIQSGFTGDNYKPQEYQALSLKDMLHRSGLVSDTTAQPAATPAPTPAAPAVATASQAPTPTNAAPKPAAPTATPATDAPIKPVATPTKKTAAQAPATPALTPTLERPFDGLAAYQKRVGLEMQTQREAAEQEYHTNEMKLATDEYKKKFGVDFSPKYDGDSPLNYRNYAQQEAAKTRYADLDKLAPRTLTPEQSNQILAGYDNSPEAKAAAAAVEAQKAAGKVYDPWAGAEPIQALRGPMSVNTPNGVAVLEGTQRNELYKPFEGQYQTQPQIDATTAARANVGDPLTHGQAATLGDGPINLIKQGMNDANDVRVAGIQGQNQRAVAGIHESGEDRRLTKTLDAKAAGLTEADILDGYSAYLAAKKGDLSGEPVMAFQEYKASVTGGAVSSAPPQAAIAYLMSNPGAAAQFDAKYGAGAAAKYLKAK